MRNRKVIKDIGKFRRWTSRAMIRAIPIDEAMKQKPREFFRTVVVTQILVHSVPEGVGKLCEADSRYTES